MMSFFAVLLVAVLNCIPANISTFTMEVQSDKTIKFTKQETGGWKGVQLPADEIGTFYVNGAMLTVKNHGREDSSDLSTVLGVDESTDWATISQLSVGREVFQIVRKENGINMISKNPSKDRSKTFSVRWGEDA